MYFKALLRGIGAKELLFSRADIFEALPLKKREQGENINRPAISPVLL